MFSYNGTKGTKGRKQSFGFHITAIGQFWDETMFHMKLPSGTGSGAMMDMIESLKR